MFDNKIIKKDIFNDNNISGELASICTEIIINMTYSIDI